MQAKPKVLPAQPDVQQQPVVTTAPPPPHRQQSVPRQASLTPNRVAAATAAAVSAAAAVGTGTGTGPSQAPPAAEAAKPLVVLLDVHLDAPVLLLPLNSTSQDHLEVDLGTMELTNRVVWEMRAEDRDRQKLLMDDMQVYVCVGGEGVAGCAFVLAGKGAISRNDWW